MSGLLTNLFLTTLLVLPSIASAQVYQWRDEHGRLHFGDQPPGGTAQPDEIRSIETQQQEQRKRLLIKIHTRQFELSEAASKRMERGIQQIFDTYTQQFRLDLNKTVEVHLNLFKEKSALDKWVKEKVDLDSLPVLGIFLPRTNEVAVWEHSAEEQELVETILHETSHVILAQLSPAAPSWLHEGMAQYFQTIEIKNGGLQVTPLSHASKLIKNWVANQELITLRKYLSIPEKEWRAMAHELHAVPYTVAWAMVYFLMEKPVGQQTIRRILHDLEKNKSWPNLYTLEQRYPGGIPRLEYDFFKWAQGDIRPHQL